MTANSDKSDLLFDFAKQVIFQQKYVMYHSNSRNALRHKDFPRIFSPKILAC